MDSQSEFSRGPGASLSLSSGPHQHLSPFTPPAQSVAPSPLPSVLTCEGKAKAIWQLPPASTIPVLPRMVLFTQLQSQLFPTGDGHRWSLHTCQTRAKTHISVYVRKEGISIATLQDYKATVEFKLYSSNSEKAFDTRSKSFVFNISRVMNGYEECFELQGNYQEPFYVEVIVNPAQNNEKSREQTQFVGLENEGNTCYINALLQTLYHLPSLRNAVFHIPSAFSRTDLAYCFQKVLYDLQISPQSVSARHLMDCLEVAEDQGQQDVHEFSLMFLEKLEASMANSAVSDFIPRLLKGRTRTIVECTEVPYGGDPQIEDFLDLQLSVSDAENIHESLKKLTVERLTGENQFDAGSFGRQNAVRKVKFQRFPPVLQIYLKRFQYSEGVIQKVNSRFEFQENLDLSEYLEQPGTAEYRLFAILVHKGVSQQGHYFAFVKTNLSEWFKFNDKSVDKVTSEQVFRSSFGGDVTDLKVNSRGIESSHVANDMSAYMLCYVKRADMSMVFNPQIAIPTDLESLLLRELPELDPYISIPRPSLSTFQLPFVTIDHLAGHTGPGLISSIDKASWLPVPNHYTAEDLKASLRRKNSKKELRMWLLTAEGPSWRFGTISGDYRLKEGVRDGGRVVFVEMENNETLVCNSMMNDILDIGGETLPLELYACDLSPPLLHPNKPLVFLKLYRSQPGFSDLILKSAANLAHEKVSVISVLAYFSLLEFRCSDRAANAKLAIEHYGMTGEYTCKTVNTEYIGTFKAENTMIIANGDALIVEFEPIWGGIPAEEYCMKLIHYTSVAFIALKLPPGVNWSEVERTVGTKGEFRDNIRRNSRLMEVIVYLCKRFVDVYPALAREQITLYAQSVNSQYTAFPRPRAESDPNNLPLSQIAPNGVIYYSISQESDLVLSLLHINSAQEPVSPDIQCTLPANSTVKDLQAAISEEIKHREKPDSAEMRLIIYEHDQRTKAYLRELQGDLALRGCAEAVLSVKVLTALEKSQYQAGAQRVNLIVTSGNAFLQPKYVIIPVFPT